MHVSKKKKKTAKRERKKKKEKGFELTRKGGFYAYASAVIIFKVGVLGRIRSVSPFSKFLLVSYAERRVIEC